MTVSHFYEAHGGGIERVAAQLCRQLADDGHRVSWAASDAEAPPNDPIEAIPLRCANPIEARLGLPMPIPGVSAIRALSRATRGSDAVIVHDALYLTSVASVIIAKLCGKPVVLIQHIAGIDFTSPILRLLMRLANQLVTRPMIATVDRLVFISNHVRFELLGEPARRDFMLLFNGVDTATFHPGGASARSLLRKALGLPGDARIAAFVGRFVEKKGMSVLKALALRRPDLHFALAGDGPVRPEEWDLPNIRVLGSQSKSNIASLYAASDLLLLPSVGEGYPLVIQESMACGLPVICGEESARADPGATRWLRGVKIDLTEPEQTALRCSAAIESVVCDPPDRAAMAAYAARTYNWQAMAGAIIKSLLTGVEPVDCAAGRYQPG